MTFGMVYWLIPRLWKTKLYSERLASTHFWIGTVGIILYVVAMWSAGIEQGLMWRAFDDTGRLMYPDFIETVVKLAPMYWVRLIGGLLYITGASMCLFNLVQTIRRAPKNLEDPTVMVPAPVWRTAKIKANTSPLYDDILFSWSERLKGGWHRILEGWPMVFTVLTIIAVSIGGIMEIVPMMLIDTNVPTISTVKPYTPLELEGRDIYIREGCVNCHSQMVRPLRSEIERYGDYSKPGETIYDRPFLWGSKRTGPDLARVGNKYPHLWHVRHMRNPRLTTPNSIMPNYEWLETNTMDLSGLTKKLEGLAMLNTPYSIKEISSAQELAKIQATQIAKEIREQGGPEGLEDKEIVALIAYLQRLGVDLQKAKELQEAH
jgi:cytochrome c oxidase cbb3-type subunit I/II